MVNVLALDTATKTGWAHSNGTSGVQDFSPRRGDSPGMRYIEFRAWLHRILDAAPVELIVYEQPGGMRSRAATHVCESLIGQAEVVATERKIEITSRSPSDLKKYIRPDVKANKRNKPRMMQYVENNWPDIKLADDNHADAILLLWYVLQDLRIEGTNWHVRHRGWNPGGLR